MRREEEEKMSNETEKEHEVHHIQGDREWRTSEQMCDERRSNESHLKDLLS